MSVGNNSDLLKKHATNVAAVIIDHDAPEVTHTELAKHDHTSVIACCECGAHLVVMRENPRADAGS